MIKNIYISLFFAAVGLFAVTNSGCRKNRVEPSDRDKGFAYLPLDSGSVWYYRLDSINFDPFTQPGIDTFTLYVKQEVVELNSDDNGNITAKISSSRSDQMQGPYMFNRFFERRIVDHRAEVIDSNIKTIHFMFPPVLYKYWDGNAFNQRTEEEFEMVQVHIKETINNVTYDSTVHVLQRDDDFRTLRNYGLEKYARHMGLVYSHQIHWTKKTIGDPDEVPDGYDYTYTLLRFEK
jgi:hypothetical protein